MIFWRLSAHKIYQGHTSQWSRPRSPGGAIHKDDLSLEAIWLSNPLRQPTPAEEVYLEGAQCTH